MERLAGQAGTQTQLESQITGFRAWFVMACGSDKENEEEKNN